MNKNNLTMSIMKRNTLIFCLLTLLFANQLYAQDYDLVILNGRVMDPETGLDGVRNVVAYVQQLSGQKADPEMADAGKAHFQTICMACHGMDGTGNQVLGAPNLTDDIWLYGPNPADIEHAVVNGRMGKMPAFKDLLSEDKIRLLTAYVLGLEQSE